MKIVFFDVDGTLTETESGATFKQNPSDIKVMNGVTNGLNFHKSKGYKLIGVSNQGGCAAINQATGKPHKSIEDAITEMKNTLLLLPQLSYICFCPDFEGLIVWKVFRDKPALEIKQHTVEEFGSFRKPGAGMINLICRNEVPSEAWLIGDRPEDDGAASAAGIDFIWANTWRARFTPGISEFKPTNLKQIEFLEGIKL